jgi:hypothetical protein
MPKDAKFGLLLGVGLVLVIAVLFSRKEPDQPNRLASAPAVSSRPVATVPAAPAPGTSDNSRSTSQTPALASPTLYSLAPAASE